MDITKSREKSDIAKLEAEREQTLKEIENLRTDLRSMAEPSADETDSDAYEREKVWALVQTLKRKIDSIDKAIASTQSGTYGICESCGERIDPARLDILPTATLCLDCQRKFERQNRRRR